MSMIEWAENEVKIACAKEAPDRKEGEFDYGCCCYESALKAFRSLCDDGHSGFSIRITQRILNRLMDGKPLTPIENTPEIWNRLNEHPHGDLIEEYQCFRMGSLFKHVYKDGSIKYTDIERGICVNSHNEDDTYGFGLVSDILDKMCPITFPYSPPNGRYRVYVEQFLAYPEEDTKNDFNTVGVLFIKSPDTDQILPVRQYYKDNPSGGWTEITPAEYETRLQTSELAINLSPKEN